MQHKIDRTYYVTGRTARDVGLQGSLSRFASGMCNAIAIANAGFYLKNGRYLTREEELAFFEPFIISHDYSAINVTEAGYVLDDGQGILRVITGESSYRRLGSAVPLAQFVKLADDPVIMKSCQLVVSFNSMSGTTVAHFVNAVATPDAAIKITRDGYYDSQYAMHGTVRDVRIFGNENLAPHIANLIKIKT